MIDLGQLRERFLREESYMRLAHIASDLSRISSAQHHQRSTRLILNMLTECKWFCEWAAIEAAQADFITTAYELLTLQRELVRWEHRFDKIYSDPIRRAEMAETARAWSDRLLQMSGLLNQRTSQPTNEASN
jgi:hypothetical protein